MTGRTKKPSAEPKSTNGSPTNGFPGPDAVWKPFAEFWNQWIQSSDQATRQWSEQFMQQNAPEQWRRQWLSAVSESCDAYMRSPAFLEAMKHQADATVKVKAQANDVAREAARNLDIPTAGDISGLFERMHSVEDTLLSRLERIEEKLARIEDKISK